METKKPQLTQKEIKKIKLQKEEALKKQKLIKK